MMKKAKKMTYSPGVIILTATLPLSPQPRVAIAEPAANERYGEATRDFQILVR